MSRFLASGGAPLIPRVGKTLGDARVGQVRQIEPKYPKSWALIHRKPFKIIQTAHFTSNEALIKCKGHLRDELGLC